MIQRAEVEVADVSMILGRALDQAMSIDSE